MMKKEKIREKNPAKKSSCGRCVSAGKYSVSESRAFKASSFGHTNSKRQPPFCALFHLYSYTWRSWALFVCSSLFNPSCPIENSTVSTDTFHRQPAHLADMPNYSIANDDLSLPKGTILSIPHVYYQAPMALRMSSLLMIRPATAGGPARLSDLH